MDYPTQGLKVRSSIIKNKYLIISDIHNINQYIVKEVPEDLKSVAKRAYALVVSTTE